MAEFTMSCSSPEDALRQTLAHFGRERVVLASSFGAEDQVLTAMLTAIEPAARIFTLDTGRLFQETYDTMQLTIERYKTPIELCAPEPAELRELLAQGGPNLFYDSIEKRKRCCEVRKLRPLRKLLATADAWICGLRREQSVTRTGVELVSRDAEFGIYKICPLFDWSESQVWDFLRAHNVPYNVLHDHGFRSIGCAPCTRAVAADEDLRAGRWWWESPEHRECGLHRSPLYQPKKS